MAVSIVRYVESRARVYRYTWRGTVISSFLNPIMYLAAMGLGLGTLVDTGSNPLVDEGISYISFLAPGLLAATMMMSASADSAWPVMAGFKWTKTYYAALATPLRVRDLVLGHLTFGAARLAFIATVFVLISAVFGAIPLGLGLVAVLPAILTGLAFAAPVMAYTAVLNKDNGLANLFRFGIVPMFLFSGTFFPITQLPGWLQPVAYLTPLWHGVALCRGIALQVGTHFHPVVHLLALATFIAVGSALAVRYLTRRMVA